MRQIEKRRLYEEQDLYLVAGQLQETNVDPIDSWTLFVWLQDHNIPSKYILKCSDVFYGRAKTTKYFNDVVVIDDYRMGYGLLENTDIWIRACAFIVEWDLGDWDLNKWIRDLPNCRYVFLQHGITGNYISDIHIDVFTNHYNDINVFSAKERNFILENTSFDVAKKCFVGGLPRYDAYTPFKHENAKGVRTLFVMLTWRNSLDSREKIIDSDYWKGLCSFLSANNIEKLRKKNLNVVVSLHHSLQKVMGKTLAVSNVSLINQDMIAYWLKNADAFLTDFSSASFDTMFMRKPTIFWIPDAKDERREEKVRSVLLNRKQFCNYAENMEDVLGLIDFYIANDFVLESEKYSIMDKWFDVKCNISQNVYEQIRKKCDNDKSYIKRFKNEIIEQRDKIEEQQIQISSLYHKNVNHLKYMQILIETQIALMIILICLCYYLFI